MPPRFGIGQSALTGFARITVVLGAEWSSVMEIIKPTVLVIDDDPINADTLAMVLNISGFKATTAYSGEGGLELARQNPFDHLITDVRMDGMNGIEAAIAIRQLLPDCRILLISGDMNTGELLDTAVARGHAFDIVAKPVYPTVLLEQMRAKSSTSVVCPAETLSDSRHKPLD
jgi:CheY-like chemotaxis protein